VGRGNLGRSLEGALRAAGHSTSLIPGRAPFIEPPRWGIVILAVPDDAVRESAEKLARLRPARRVAVVHASGALGLDALKAFSENPVGSFHPLQSFPRPRRPSAFRGITVAIDATTPALLRRLARLARDLGARPVRVTDEQRVLYHAAAVFASNYVDVIVEEAVSLLAAVGWTEKEATIALLPLVEGSIGNIRARGAVAALTGPIRRGDVATVSRHLAALRAVDDSLRPPAGGPRFEAVYRMLGEVAVGIAIEAGLDPEAAGRLHRALTVTTAATRRRNR
jgi:predicted short-subunit dehydrogenase-like oxidoreductase (DUF2520 family)